MAAEDAADGEIEALERTMLSECLEGVLGTGGGEPAGRRGKRTDARLIELDQEYEGEDQYVLQPAVFHAVAPKLHVINHLSRCPLCRKAQGNTI